MSRNKHTKTEILLEIFFGWMIVEFAFSQCNWILNKLDPPYSSSIKADPGNPIPKYTYHRYKDLDDSGLAEQYITYQEPGKPKLAYIIKLHEENGKQELYLSPYELIPKQIKPLQRQHRTQDKGGK